MFSMDKQVAMAMERLIRCSTDGTVEANNDRRLLSDYMAYHMRPDNTTCLATELIEATVAKAEELGFYVKSQNSEVHRDMMEGDAVIFAIRLVRKLTPGESMKEPDHI